MRCRCRERRCHGPKPGFPRRQRGVLWAVRAGIAGGAKESRQVAARPEDAFGTCRYRLSRRSARPFFSAFRSSEGPAGNMCDPGVPPMLMRPLRCPPRPHAQTDTSCRARKPSCSESEKNSARRGWSLEKPRRRRKRSVENSTSSVHFTEKYSPVLATG